MLYNYFKIIFRNFLTDKLYTAINAGGLAMGIAACLMIAQYVQFELSFDKEPKDRSRIYYTYSRVEGDGRIRDFKTDPAFGPFAKGVVPEISGFARMIALGLDAGHEYVVRKENSDGTSFYSKEDELYFADQSILSIFSVPMLEGNRDRALLEPNTMVITKALADKFFPGESALNKTLKIQTVLETKECLITGVTANPPVNSSLQYNALFSFIDLDALYLKNDKKKAEEIWIHPRYTTFLLLDPGADGMEVQRKINQAAATRFEEMNKLFNTNDRRSIRLLPLEELHFYRPVSGSGGWGDTIHFTGDRRLLILFSVLAILILTISWVNYINLTTARALRRAKEVGLRKVSGASRGNLVVQFLAEYFFLNLVSLMLALTLAQLFFPVFASVIGSSAQWIFWREHWFWVAIVSFLIFSTLAAGTYPAIILSGYNPSRVLKGSFSRSSSGGALRRGLVIAQFAISIFMMVSIYVVRQQLNYMQNGNLGMSTNQVMVIGTIDLDTAIDRTLAFEEWRARLQNLPSVRDVSATSIYPGSKMTRGQRFVTTLNPTRENEFLGDNYINGEFFNGMEMKMIQGRDFTPDQRAEKQNVIINETAAKLLGFEDPAEAVGVSIIHLRYNTIHNIIGVVKDFKTSLKQLPRGEIFFNTKVSPWHELDFFLVKIDGVDLNKGIQQIKDSWSETFPGTPFDYFFLDTYFDTFYREERQFAGVFGFFCFIGVAVACLGLFGLSSYNTTSRTKEIGIRKSLGASSSGIIWMFSKDYVRLVIGASVVGIPVGMWALNEWLKTYPNRINLQMDVALIPMLLMLSIAIATVGFQTYRSALTNPVEALKYE